MANQDTVDNFLLMLFKADVKLEWLTETEIGKKVQALNNRTIKKG